MAIFTLNQTLKDTFESLSHNNYKKIESYICNNSVWHNVDELVDNYTFIEHSNDEDFIDELLNLQNDEVSGIAKFSQFIELADRLIADSFAE